MSDRSKLSDALTEFMGSAEAAEDLLSQADITAQRNRDNEVIIRENEDDTEEVSEEVEEEVEETTEEVETEEVSEEAEIEYELEMTDEIIDDIAQVVVKSKVFTEILSELKQLRATVAEIREDENDDVPVRQRRVIRPTLRNKGEDEGQTAVEVEKEEINRNDKSSMASRRSQILSGLRSENSSGNTQKKKD